MGFFLSFFFFFFGKKNSGTRRVRKWWFFPDLGYSLILLPSFITPLPPLPTSPPHLQKKSNDSPLSLFPIFRIVRVESITNTSEYIPPGAFLSVTRSSSISSPRCESHRGHHHHVCTLVSIAMSQYLHNDDTSFPHSCKCTPTTVEPDRVPRILLRLRGESEAAHLNTVLSFTICGEAVAYMTCSTASTVLSNAVRVPVLWYSILAFFEGGDTLEPLLLESIRALVIVDRYVWS